MNFLMVYIFLKHYFLAFGYNTHLLYIWYFKLELILPISSLIHYTLAIQTVIDLWTSSLCGTWLEMQRLRSPTWTDKIRT